MPHSAIVHARKIGLMAMYEVLCCNNNIGGLSDGEGIWERDKGNPRPYGTIS